MTIAEKLTLIAENQQRVYEAGKSAGGGGDNWYDTFWDIFQQNGNRTNYGNAFSGATANDACVGWTNVNFKPKYSFNNILGYSMFDNSRIEGSLPEILNELGITLTFSGYQSSGFTNTQFTEIDYINNSMSTMVNVFTNNKRLKTLKIGKIPASTKFQTVFTGCSALENLTLDGVIAQNGFDVSQSPLLTKASIENIINTLSPTTSGMSVTLSKEAVNNAFGIDVDDASTYPEGSEYYTLRHSRDNWTINYI